MTDDAPVPSRIDVIAERFWEDFLRLSPTTATVYGDDRYDDRLDDPGPEGRAAVRALLEQSARETQAIAEDGLPVEDRITRDTLRIISETISEADDLGFHEIREVDQIDNPMTGLAQLAQFQRADTPERLEQVARPAPRLRSHRGRADPGHARWRRLRTDTRTDRRRAADRPASPDRCTLRRGGGADRDVPRRVGRGSRPRGRRRARRRPARRPALPRDPRERRSCPRPARSPGSSRRPTATRSTGTPSGPGRPSTWSPADVHQVGLDELAHDRRGASRDRPRRGLRRRRRRLPRWRSPPISPTRRRPRRRSLPAPPRTSPARRRSPRACSGACRRAGCEVRPVEAFKEQNAPFAYYYPPAIDGSRDGTYYVNTYDLPSRTYSKLASTTYHEAIPGHHFQITLEMEHPSLNSFRRLGARLAGGAYVEGWGLYSERLADELGLYRNAAERFGMLDAQAWRASRLIVDSGMHGLGWSRRQSVDWLLSTGLVRDGREHRDRPLHRVAGPGADLHAGHARDPPPAPRARGPRRGPVRPEALPRRADRPRVAAAGDAGPGAAALGGTGGVAATVRLTGTAAGTRPCSHRTRRSASPPAAARSIGSAREPPRT